MISLAEIQQLPNYTQTLELFDTIYQGERSCVPEGLKTRRELIQQELAPKGEPVALWIHSEGVEALFEEACCRLSPQLSVVARTRLYRYGVRPLGMTLRIQGKARYFAAKDTEPLSLKNLSREEYQQWRRGIRELLKQQKQEISEKERVILTLMLHLLDRFPPLSTSIFELELAEGMTAVEQAKQAADKRKDHRHRLTDVTEADHQAFLLCVNSCLIRQPYSGCNESQ